VLSQETEGDRKVNVTGFTHNDQAQRRRPRDASIGIPIYGIGISQTRQARDAAVRCSAWFGVAVICEWPSDRARKKPFCPGG